MDNVKKKALKVFAAEIRLETTKMVAKRGFGHLGGSLSVADVLAYLYSDYMHIDPKKPAWEDRDILVMSKGHAGPALYATLALKGYFDMALLETLNQPGTHLPSHCDRKLTPGIDMTTGSLGQGVSAAVGMALARQLDKKPQRTFLFVGDGECDEGQVWEGAMFAAQHKLANMVWFIDYNKKQLDGTTEEIMDLRSYADKFKAFGFAVHDINGHCFKEIDEALRAAEAERERPTCIVLNTVKGKGIPELENMQLNHHVQIDEKFATAAIEHLTAALEAARREEA